MRMGAFGVIFDDERRVLLCHRRDMDVWNLPGGGVEDGESPWDAAVREVREEVCLDVEIARLTGLYWKPESSELVFNFECRVLRGSPTLTDEADDIRFFALDEIPANTGQKHVERIRDALAMSSGTVLKVQSGGPSMRDMAGARSAP